MDLAFISDRDGEMALYVINHIRGSLERYSEPGYEVFRTEPEWSPDGNRILYSAEREQDQDEVLIVDIRSGETINLADGYYPHWSPDGSKILFMAKPQNGNRCVSIIDADGNNLDCIGAAGSENVSSPDGVLMATIGKRIGVNDDEWGLFVQPIKTTWPTRLADASGIFGDFDWKPIDTD